MITNKEAFKKGRKAYNDGQPKSSNPYPKYDKNELKTANRDHISWNQGYEYVEKNGLKESKFEQYLQLLENEEFEIAHKPSHTSKEVEEIRAKEGIKFIPDDGHPTQRSNTVATYEKFYKLIPDHNKEGVGLDYSAGLGLGSELLRNNHNAHIESYEPFPHATKAVNITHKGLNSLPNRKYDYIINSAVLNVVEQDIRDGIVKDIWNHLKPEGIAIIGVRSKADVMGTKTALRISDTEIIDRTRGSYQKGFTSGELKSYIQSLLPDAAINMVSGMSQVVVKISKDYDWDHDAKDVETIDTKKPHPIAKYLFKDKEGEE